MRGAKIHYNKLGALLRAGREKAGLNLETAAMMLGLVNKSYLSRCELGTCNFPVKKLKRAMELYDIAFDDVIENAISDYEKGMITALKEGA